MIKSLIFTLSLILASFSTYAFQAFDFSLVQSQSGYKLYYSSTRNAYVQEVDLQSAMIDMQCKSIQGQQCENVSIGAFWDSVKSSAKVMSVTNGQFHDQGTPYANLALAVASKNGIISDGYDSGGLNQRLVIFNQNNATIYHYHSVSALAGATNGGILGYHPIDFDAGGKKNQKIGRTMLGLKLASGSCDPQYASCLMRYAYIVTAKAATQAEAVKILNDFGVHTNAIAMLDGSGSTQMQSKFGAIEGCRYQPIAGACPWTSRNIPQYMVVRQKWYQKENA